MEPEVFCNPLHYIEVMRHKYADTLTDWCCIELSHVLEFSGPEGLGQILAGNVNVRQGKTITKKFTKAKKKVHETEDNTGIFGAALTSQAFCQTRQLIDFLRMNSSREGLFRIPGNSERQRRLKSKLNSGQLIDLNNDEFTAHDVACVLKTYLGDLPEPVLTEKHYLAHVQAAALTYKLDALTNYRPDELQRLKAKRLNDHISALTYLFLMLPSTNFKLLKELLELLHDVARQHDVNKMTAYNLGVMFAPHLLWPRYLTTDELKNQEFIHKLNCAMEFMITHCERIFKVPARMLHKCETYVRHGGMLPDEIDEEAEEVMNQTVRDQYDGGRRSTDMISAPLKGSVELTKESSSTEQALAKLYADVQSMPEGSKKRKVMKQFTKNSYLPGTPDRVREAALKRGQHRHRHTRSKSLGEMIVKVGTPFNSKKKHQAPAPPPEETEVIRTHNTNRDLRNEFRSHLKSHQYRKRANSCDALDSCTESYDDMLQRPSSPRKPARPAPSTPESKASPRPVPAPRAITPKTLGSTPKRNHEGRGANLESRQGVAPRHRKRNSDGQPIPSPRDTTNTSGSGGRRPVPKPRMINNLAKENNPHIAAPRRKRESAL